MSLAVLADHMASKGRNGDTMLVHMTPGEVQGLQALALAHGGSLSINPETGLVEASWLKRLLPMIAGVALGPAGFGLMSAVQAGLAVGAVTGLATGSLKQGIVAGLGAYGGAQLGAGLSAAGEAGLQAAAGQTALETAASQIADPAEAMQYVQQQVAAKAAAATPYDKLISGVTGLGSEAGRQNLMASFGGATGAGGLSNLARAGMMAAAPVMADAMVPTATKMPALNQYPGMVRPFTYDPYSQSYTSQEPYKAAGGGIVALADGGLPDSPYAAQIAAGQQAIPYATGVRASREDIGKIYQDLLGRSADPGGLEFYYASQFSPEQIRENIRQSDEYINRPVTGPTIAPTGTPTSAAPGPVTGGTVTPGAMETIGGGQPITVSPVKAETVPGYTGEDRTYGGTEVLKQVEPAPLGTSGSVTQENLTMKDVRDAYEQAGGRTGPTQTPFTPTPVTGGSKAAYDYLMGRGPYPTTPFTQTGEIMRPYAEVVLGMPVDKTRSKYIFDPATRQYIENPDYKAPTFPDVPSTDSGGQPIIRNPAGVPYTGKAASYFAANPDVKAAYENDVRGMTPEAYADYHWNTFGKNEGRKGYSESVNPAPIGSGSKEPNADIVPFARGGLSDIAAASAARGGQFNLGGYSDGGRLLRGPGDGVSDSIPATIGGKQPARLADGEFVIPARIVSEIGNGSTEAGARKLYAMMDRVQRARAKTTGKGKVAKNTRADKYLPA